MSELKSFIVLYNGKFIRAYEESEVDEVIAEKDKEIARLDDLTHAHNIELLRKENLIAELEAKLESVRQNRKGDKVMNEIKVYELDTDYPNDIQSGSYYDKNEADKAIARHKYKRCLAMADSCKGYIKYWHMRYLSAAGYDRSYEKRKHKWLIRWRNRWLKIAEQFLSDVRSKTDGGKIMSIELHHLHPSHDDELSRLKARIAELEEENAELKAMVATDNSEVIARLEAENMKLKEQKQQIDYDSLEWFDCKNNFPPMSIDLYVDSEHGYGIGRLGRRVKDKSIIWTVHLDSGENYLVYAFYKVKRWAYMPRNSKQTQPSTERRAADDYRHCHPRLCRREGSLRVL